MKYFKNCKTPEEAKVLYKSLAKKLHPDMPTGNKERFQAMEQQYRTFLSETLSQKQEEFSNNFQFTSYVKTFFSDNPELMDFFLKSLFQSKSVKTFIKNNSNVIDAGIGIYNLLKQNQ